MIFNSTIESNRVEKTADLSVWFCGGLSFPQADRAACGNKLAGWYRRWRLVSFYSFFRVKKIPMIVPIRIIGAILTNSHSNE